MLKQEPLDSDVGESQSGFEDAEIDMMRLTELLDQEVCTQYEKNKVFELIDEPDQTESYRQLI